jgi:hypothetical protein
MRKTSDATPIWYTRWPGDLDAQIALDYVCKGGSAARLELSNASRAFTASDESNEPEYLYFEGNSKFKPAYRDAFKIVGGLLVVSKKFRDVLVEFDLGSSRLYRVPIYRDEQKTPSDLAPHYVLHVSEQKPDTFVPDRSTNVQEMRHRGFPDGRPLGKWQPFGDGPDLLAVNQAAAAGVDLWADPKLTKRLFLTDRLKRAIEAAGVKSRALNFQEAILV